MRHSVIFACLLCALAAPARALAQVPPAHEVTLAAAARIVYGHSLKVTGTVAPAVRRDLGVREPARDQLQYLSAARTCASSAMSAAQSTPSSVHCQSSRCPTTADR
jgi:hypothetical protein